MRGIFRLMWLGLAAATAACRGQEPRAAVRPSPATTEAARRLEADVRALAGDIGERNFDRPGTLARAAAHIEKRLRAAGYSPEVQEYPVGSARGQNVVAALAKPVAPVLVIGAHYDSENGTPGADDNASGVAGLLELARRLKDLPGRLEIRFVAFGSEEAPYFGTSEMGSDAYAERLLAEGRNVEGMISLEMLGYFSDAPGSQDYPVAAMKRMYPDRGDFIGIVANPASRALGESLARGWGEARPPFVSAALPESVSGVSLSDQLPFWRRGVPAVMITDTAFLRNPNYHRASDTPETLDYERMAGVIDGLERAIRALCAHD